MLLPLKWRSGARGPVAVSPQVKRLQVRAIAASTGASRREKSGLWLGFACGDGVSVANIVCVIIVVETHVNPKIYGVKEKNVSWGGERLVI